MKRKRMDGRKRMKERKRKERHKASERNKRLIKGRYITIKWWNELVIKMV